jgi:hypothetical protein
MMEGHYPKEVALPDTTFRFTGGCLCGELRYEAEGQPAMCGLCYCADCRKASGSGFVPFMGFASSAVRFTGTPMKFVSKAANGNEAVRNSCPYCASLVFGGEIGITRSYTIYAGSLDDPSWFRPQVAIFTRGRAQWVTIPPGLREFEQLPS